MSDHPKPDAQVEVAFITHDGTIWTPATVVYVADDHISVEFPDGRRQLARLDQWRFPKATRPEHLTFQPSPTKQTRGA